MKKTSPLLFVSVIIMSVIPTFIAGQVLILSGNKTYYYDAQYCDSVNHLFLKDKIQFITTDIPWKSQPDKQTSAIWRYPHSEQDSLLRARIKSIGWIRDDTTGVIENDKKLWIHPPRHCQYTITEIAPFPDVEFPCEINKKYGKILYIGNGWGEWDNLKIKSSYEIVGKESRKIGTKNCECWIIESESDSELGISHLTTAYNEKIGFVEFIYSFYNEVKIKIELMRIE
ncbi:MAG: hypothetical protein NTU44_08130 [Bacteroidetes bacterium]|nr:hypothetical protein [Bacteroidota bacterium]